MNIYFVRHGQTNENNNKYYYGKLDVSLNEKGLSQAEQTKKLLSNIEFDDIYVSDRKRASQTAKIILGSNSKEIITDERLNEMNLGKFEGKNYKEIMKLYPEEWKKWSDDWKSVSPPEGESYVEFYSRVKSFMDDILKLNKDNVLVVTHSGVIRSVYCYVLNGILDFFWKFSSKNGDITLVKYEYSNLFIDSITHVNT
ncbi:alpha-ribazole phosphatase [Clostridium autoethanogenum]|uniref:Alpha-ribazole phosphatase n=2 Tax=Clostridium autoethanogenum TaxID=84023 RepID=A0A3M0SER6_9CLOT|nr:alpha-ribazole phosphatase [Clostridium autoethanogenum]AGY75687.1 alpha-ribazole phosphatase [Clostridium autoethanogenum DSM 10061]ALU35851.1 Alpha-ribazole phosphatase [Clostridium autoethanogenum DSM 10061]OVY52090.1 Phosphoserine phosphatase 1 [Clostridium autoethanogenum]RMC96154.1 alpha-ribazole phosphatase [Clostridium autoethanogenum]